MFSGLVEALEKVLSAEPREGACRLRVSRPATFSDLKTGDSVAVNGACLTVESVDGASMTFTLAAESLRVLGWTAESLRGTNVNLERSLRFGDRLHGHLVSGHVEGLARVVRREQQGESLFLDFAVPTDLRPMIWKKGAIALNGVSLTVNEFKNDTVSVCLIPETLRRTNLAALRPGDAVNVEPDWMTKAILGAVESGWRPAGWKENVL